MYMKYLSISVGLFLLGVSHAAATTYTYTGNDFTVAGAPYTTSDSVSGYFTVATPLGPNLVDQTITPLTFSFTDGPDTVSNTNDTGGNGSGSVFLFFYTNSAGLPIDWYFSVASAVAGMFSNKNINGNFGDEGAEHVSPYAEAYNGANINPPGSAGSWSSVSTTPLPAALPLFATGLGALGLLGWRRKRKNAAAIAA
jgi:hypothetical protein